MPQPLRHNFTKSAFAYAHLRDDILSGELEPGQVLQQSMLAKTIGISTTPLREALRQLMSEGLVELDAHRDARVTLLKPEEARDLLEVRLSLDPLACSLAAQRRTKEDIRRMRECYEPCEPLRPGATAADLKTHHAFHQAIYEASHNELLITTLNGLWAKANRYRLLGLDLPLNQEDLDRRDQQHAALLDAVIRGDSEAAFTITKQHINTSLGAKAASHLGVETALGS